MGEAVSSNFLAIKSSFIDIMSDVDGGLYQLGTAVSAICTVRKAKVTYMSFYFVALLKV